MAHLAPEIVANPTPGCHGVTFRSALVAGSQKQSGHREGGQFVLMVEAGGIEPPSDNAPPSDLHA